ncbi:MAG: FAD-dependent oxidoreductase [Patescibacteria group bacterium]|nr:FAD-dependent oxidoreductase [Patescibacteria group bacterium]
MSNNKKIKILLIGAGRFGRKHLRVLKQLDSENIISLYGVVVKSKKSREQISKEFNVPVFTEITETLLSEVDAVDIVTPIDTHFEIVKKCLPFVDVFVEKPLASNYKDSVKLSRLAKKYKKKLMVGHIFRFHSLLYLLKKHIPKSNVLEKVEGFFVSPIETDTGLSAPLELLHLFDIIDALYKKNPSAIWSKQNERITNIDLRYEKGLNVLCRIGWEGDKKERVLKFYLKKGNIDFFEANFANWELKIVFKDGNQKIIKAEGEEPLVKEIKCFIDVMNDKKIIFPDGEIGARIVSIAERSIVNQTKPNIAIIGAGIFGMTTASILGEKFKVTIFERHKDILTEASYANQYRHHQGYHYPRSPETIKQIKESTTDFEEMYGKAIVNIPSYIAVACEGSKITKEGFEKMCHDNKLYYKEEYPTEGFLNKDEVVSCIKTNEAVYDYGLLKKIMKEKIRSKNISLKLSSEVKKIKIAKDGKKVLTFSSNSGYKTEAFDYVINATYANYNTVVDMLGFSKRELEYRFKEFSVIQIKEQKPQAVMVVDGPFTTIVPLGNTDFYTFGDVPLSVHTSKKIYSDKDFQKWKKNVKPRILKMLKRSSQWLPILKQATYVKSIFVALTIDKSSKKNDDRVTSLVNHGFGCFSVLEGKIITSVTIAKKLKKFIL